MLIEPNTDEFRCNKVIGFLFQFNVVDDIATGREPNTVPPNYQEWISDHVEMISDKSDAISICIVKRLVAHNCVS